MIKLKNKENGREIGSISEEQLQFLIDQLEEESSDDQDYWLNRDTLEFLKDNGADAELVSLLESAFGDGEELEIVWVRSE